MGIWPFSSFFPFQYSWSLQPSAKQDFKPDSGAKTPEKSRIMISTSEHSVISRHLTPFLCLAFSTPKQLLDRLQSLETDKAHALCTYSLADTCCWCNSSSQANFLTILLLMPTKWQSWPLIVGFYCSCDSSPQDGASTQLLFRVMSCFSQPCFPLAWAPICISWTWSLK